MRTHKSGNGAVLKLRVEEMVEVRSKSEILATLDANGAMDALPFMPEMLQFCGKRFRVYKRADKVCDTISKTGSRRMRDAVHLEGLRCDGEAHGGCQAGCLIFWKEAWLRRVQTPLLKDIVDSFAVINTAASQGQTQSRAVESEFGSARRGIDTASRVEETFSCQATELSKATSYLAWWDVRQYVRVLRSGNIGLFVFGRGVSISIFNNLVRFTRNLVFTTGHLVTARFAAHAGTGTTMGSNLIVDAGPPVSEKNGILDYVKSTLGNLLVEYPHVQGKLRKTPSGALNLQPGEFVRVKSKDEILATLDINNKNRGLSFDVEMVPYCGGVYRVLCRVEKIIDEKTGKMLKLPNDCVILDGVMCGGCLSRNRLFCSRSIYPYWREIWLTRVEGERANSRTSV